MVADRRPTLVLLAGLLCDRVIWEPVATQLARRADILIFSFPFMSSLEDMADHVTSSVSGRFALTGHSMGGRVALEIIRKAPQRVTGVALLNTGTHGPEAQEAQSRGRLVALAREQGMSALAKEWLPPMMASRDTSRDEDDVLATLTSMVERQSAESYAAQIDALLHRPSAADVLPGIRVPALLISADQDTWSPPQQHEAMRRLCPAAELVIIKDAGHMAPVEQPSAVAEALDEGLKRVGAHEE